MTEGVTKGVIVPSICKRTIGKPSKGKMLNNLACHLMCFSAGDEIYHYNVKTKAVDEKEFKSMPNCTSAFRFMEHYYCFHGHMFSKFDPKTGEVHGKYPKEARDYFMRCAKFSEYQSDIFNKQIPGIIVTLLP